MQQSPPLRQPTAQVGGNQDSPYNPVALEDKSAAPSPSKEIQHQASQQPLPASSGQASLSMGGLLALSKALMGSFGLASTSNASTNTTATTTPPQRGTCFTLYIIRNFSQSLSLDFWCSNLV